MYVVQSKYIILYVLLCIVYLLQFVRKSGIALAAGPTSLEDYFKKGVLLGQKVRGTKS